MASWDAFASFVRQRHAVDDERDGYLQLLLDTVGGRSQIVLLKRVGRGRQVWAHIDSTVGLVDRIDAVAVLREAAGLTCGALVVVDGELVLRHAVALENLDENEVEGPIALIAAAADDLERRFSTGDRH